MSITKEELLVLLNEVKAMTEQQEKEKGKALSEVEVMHRGSKITLPAVPSNMSYENAITILEKRMEEMEGVVTVSHVFEAFPWDGAVQFARALKVRYGWVEESHSTVQGFFGPKNVAPDLKPVEVSWGVFEKVLWGTYAVQAIEGQMSCDMTAHNSRVCFRISAKIKRKYKQEFDEIVALTTQLLRTHSIYRGKAIRPTLLSNTLNYQEPPSFIKTDEANKMELIFSKDVQQQIDTNLLTPIRHTDLCKQMQVPIKRGVLFEGPFGVGKTLTAYHTAAICEENNWTFILLGDVSCLADAVKFAKHYQPAVVFAEDVDRVVKGERDISMDQVLNIIDGVDSKTSDIIVVLTTNDVDAINPAMIRPGRLDAIISLSAPDEEAAARLVTVYSRGMLAEDADMKIIGDTLRGQIPATIREVVERAKLYGLSRTKSVDFKINHEDIVGASNAMKRHVELLNRNKKKEPTPAEVLATGLVSVFKANGLGTMEEQVENIESKVNDIHANQ